MSGQDDNLDKALRSVQIGVDLLREDRERLTKALEYNASGLERLLELARAECKPVTLAYDKTSDLWRCSYGFGGSSSAMGMSPDLAARTVLDQVRAAA